MIEFIVLLFLVAGVCFGLLLLQLSRNNKLAVKEAEDAAADKIQDDIRLRDVILANDIRKRSAAVPDKLPSPDPSKPPTEKRRGRRGAL